MPSLPEAETRAVVRNSFREIIAIVFVVANALIFLADIQAVGPTLVELSDFEALFIAAFFFISVGAAGFLVWGKDALEQGWELYNQIRGADSGEE